MWLCLLYFRGVLMGNASKLRWAAVSGLGPNLWPGWPVVALCDTAQILAIKVDYNNVDLLLVDGQVDDEYVDDDVMVLIMTITMVILTYSCAWSQRPVSSPS